MNSKEKQTLKNVIRMREKGLIEDSILLFNELLKDHSSDGRVLVEGINLSLLREQNEQAYNFYMALKQLPNASTFWGVEYLLRLKIVMSEHQIPETELVNTENASKWVVRYQNSGTDPLYPVTIKNCSITCPYGAVTFNFIGNCSSCKSNYLFFVHQNILISRDFLCPVCLARQSVDYEIIKTYLEEKFAYPNASNLGIDQVNRKVREINDKLNVDAVGGKQFPLFCKYLGAEYSCLLSQFIIERLYPSTERSKQ